MAQSKLYNLTLDDNGETGPYVNGVKHGTWQQYLDDGTLCKQTEYVNGVEHGPCQQWHNNHRMTYTAVNGKLEGEYVKTWKGVVVQRGSYVNSKKHGVWCTFYPTGQVQSETEYASGVMMKKTRWHPTGEIDKIP